jgi:hypothetical protein
MPLQKAGISPQRAYSYVQRGWLQKIGRGVFVRPGAPLDLRASLRALETSGFQAHVGGKTALDWYGARHYVRVRPRVMLYGVRDQRLPAWITANFDVVYRRRNLFREKGSECIAVSRFEDSPRAPLVTEPERAILELLSEVPHRQSIEEARQLMQGLVSLRPVLLQRLLRACRSVKTVRLFLTLSRDLNLAHVKKLDVKKLPTGSKSRWVSKRHDTTLVLKP